MKKQDFDGKFQTILPPKIDERFVGQRIQVKFEMVELDCTQILRVVEVVLGSTQFTWLEPVY